jgi:hypothetical protein
MDSVSHTRVGRLLLDYIRESCGVTFDEAAFLYGNLKPDLTGTYLTKRHYPSVMQDEVMEKMAAFLKNHHLEKQNGRELSVDLGEICHYWTDFFCYPHNDDIYPHNLLAHYIYEKRMGLTINRRLSVQRFRALCAGVRPCESLEELDMWLCRLHEIYHTSRVPHGIETDIDFICWAVTALLLSFVQMAFPGETNETPQLPQALAG